MYLISDSYLPNIIKIWQINSSVLSGILALFKFENSYKEDSIMDSVSIEELSTNSNSIRDSLSTIFKIFEDH